MMGSLGAVGMGAIGNHVVGLGGFNNVINMGGVRGVGGTGVSAPIRPISSIGNMSQNPITLSQASNITNASHSGALSSAQAACIAKLTMTKNRKNMLGGPQSSISGMTGAKQRHQGSADFSMLGPFPNRANINLMQHTTMGAMAPPKPLAGTNLYMNQQQHLQHHHQEMLSSQQAVVSTQQVGSPSNMGILHQMNQQRQGTSQQITLQAPMSPPLSSGAIHPMNSGTLEARPASPQLSSQREGHLGNITNSSMELRGNNKSNSTSKSQS